MNEDPNVKETNAPVKTAAKPEAAKPEAAKPETVKPKAAKTTTAQPKAAKPKIKESSSKEASTVKKTQEKAKEKAKEKEKKEKVKKIRTLCKLVKKDLLKKNFKEYQELVTDPHFICRKCGRVAKEKQYLCKPVLILMEVKLKDSEMLQDNEPKLSQEEL